MFRKLILVLLIFIFSLLNGCSSSSIQYKHIDGTSNEFSKDIYDVLKGFEEDLNDPLSDNISYRDDSVGSLFLNKYNTRILNKREQEIYEVVEDAIETVQATSVLNISHEEFNNAIKENAEKILQEIEE